AVDALRVLAGAGVLRLERARERSHGFAVRALQQPPLPSLELEQVAEIARVEEELLVLVALAERPERRPVQATGEALDDREQLERAERLEHERVCADFRRRRVGRQVG